MLNTSAKLEKLTPIEIFNTIVEIIKNLVNIPQEILIKIIDDYMQTRASNSSIALENEIECLKTVIANCDGSIQITGSGEDTSLRVEQVSISGNSQTSTQDSHCKDDTYFRILWAQTFLELELKYLSQANENLQNKFNSYLVEIKPIIDQNLLDYGDMCAEELPDQLTEIKEKNEKNQDQDWKDAAVYLFTNTTLKLSKAVDNLIGKRKQLELLPAGSQQTAKNLSGAVRDTLASIQNPTSKVNVQKNWPVASAPSNQALSKLEASPKFDVASAAKVNADSVSTLLSLVVSGILLLGGGCCLLAYIFLFRRRSSNTNHENNQSAEENLLSTTHTTPRSGL